MIDINIAADGTITLYECDPAKNTACKHEWCAANHPNEPNLQCHRTTNPDFALKGTRPVQVDTRTGSNFVKNKQAPIRRTQTSDPAKMRQDIIRQFETLPDDTRDIIAQFYIMALSEMLPKWQKTGNKARKTAEKKK